jgi:hypothetical protein
MAVAIMYGCPHYLHRNGVETLAGHGLVRLVVRNVTKFLKKGSVDGGRKRTLLGRISKWAAWVPIMVEREDGRS